MDKSSLTAREPERVVWCPFLMKVTPKKYSSVDAGSV
jgi:hypothetical protein